MGRQRSPNRDKAFEIYKENKGNIQLREIAKILGIPEKTVSGWKVKDKWDEKLNGVLQKKKRSTPKEKNSSKVKVIKPDIEVVQDDGLTDMQRYFSEIYVRNFNATQAAIKAGYSPDTAHVQGPRLLGNVRVRQYIDELKELKKLSIMLTEDDILERYMRIAFADMTDFVEFGQEDVPVMTMFGPAKDDEGNLITKRVNIVKFKDSAQVDGGLICQIKQGKDGASIKLEDRQKALDWLANFFEMNPEHKHKKWYDSRKLDMEEKRLELEKLKVTGEGSGSNQEAIDNFIESTTMTEDEVRAMFEGEDDGEE